MKRADGPERVFGEWWERDTELNSIRDYFRVEDEASERSGSIAPVTARSPRPVRASGFLHGIFG